MSLSKSTEEIDAQKMLECRKIVKNLVNFGISEQQKLQIIKLIALEMESRDALEIITNAVKKVENTDENTKFSLTQQNNEYNKEEDKKLIY